MHDLDGFAVIAIAVCATHSRCSTVAERSQVPPAPHAQQQTASPAAADSRPPGRQLDGLLDANIAAGLDSGGASPWDNARWRRSGDAEHVRGMEAQRAMMRCGLIGQLSRQPPQRSEAEGTNAQVTYGAGDMVMAPRDTVLLRVAARGVGLGAAACCTRSCEQSMHVWHAWIESFGIMPANVPLHRRYCTVSS